MTAEYGWLFDIKILRNSLKVYLKTGLFSMFKGIAT